MKALLSIKYSVVIQSNLLTRLRVSMKTVYSFHYIGIIQEIGTNDGIYI